MKITILEGRHTGRYLDVRDNGMVIVYDRPGISLGIYRYDELAEQLGIDPGTKVRISTS